MKNSKRILSFLFFALMGTIAFMSAGIAPALGLLLGFASYLPVSFPVGVFATGMTAEEEEKEKALIQKLDDRVNELVKKMNLGGISKEYFEEQMKPFIEKLEEFKNSKFVNSEELEKVTKAFDTLSADVQKIKESGNSEVKGGFVKALKSSYDDIAKRFKDDPELKDATLIVKALPLTTATWTGSTNYPFLEDDKEDGIVNEPRSPQTFRNDVPVGAPIGRNSDTWTWIERGTIVNNTGTVAENAIFGTVEVAYNKKETKVKKIANYTKITREMIEDWDEFLEAVNDLIATLNNEKLSDQLLNGDGLTTNLSGIVINSVEFDANGIEEANPTIWDVIRLTIAQILINGLTGWMPNKIYMNPADVASQEIAKDTTGNYVFPPFIMPNGMTVKGIQITETTDIPQGYFEICDITKSRMRFKRELELRIWEQNEDDAIYDRLTITGSLRVAFRIKDLEKPAFVYDSFANAISIIEGTAAALAFILAMAPVSDASKLTINGLIKAGVTGTVAASLDDYKVAVAAEASIADLAALQVVIDAA